MITRFLILINLLENSSNKQTTTDKYGQIRTNLAKSKQIKINLRKETKFIFSR
jgi:hypothetical protein